jgi:hypothetical protein
MIDIIEFLNKIAVYKNIDDLIQSDYPLVLNQIEKNKAYLLSLGNNSVKNINFKFIIKSSNASCIVTFKNTDIIFVFDKYGYSLNLV